MSRYEDAQIRVLDALIQRGGEWEEEPGELLKAIATECDIPYQTASLAVLALERVDFVSVERSTQPDPHRANKLIRIVIT